MSSFHENVHALLHADMPTSFEQFGGVLDAECINLALEETGTASIRQRKLPAASVVWLVIGMALFRDRSIHEVVAHLGLVFSTKKTANVMRSIAPSALPQARERLGSQPIELIFVSTAEHWAQPAAREGAWRGLSLYGVDGSTFRVADTEENREAFGLPGSSRGQTGYPQVRAVTLMALRSHLIAAAAMGPCKGKQTGELSLARALWDNVPKNSLTIMDKLYLSWSDLCTIAGCAQTDLQMQRNWLVRAKSNTQWTTIKRFAPGDELVEIKPSSAARKKCPNLPDVVVARAIQYQIKGYEPQWLLTSLTDPQTYPAHEIAELYHERWELELSYDEIKTHMLEREEALRSKTAEGTRQELWGILLAYNLVRYKILEVAKQHNLEPNRISFRHSVHLIRIFCLVHAWSCAPTKLPTRLSELTQMLNLLILPERRPERRYKRHIKIKMSRYKRNPGKPAKYAT